AKDSDDSPGFRTALRQEKIAARVALDPATHAELSARLAAHLEPLLLAQAATLTTPTTPTLAFCAPVRNEFDARPLASRLIRQGWRAAMPVVIAPAAPMIFRAWTPHAPMSRDRHGIPIPTAGEELVPDIVLLPLVAFDAAGYRLGYGGGYFDRTLVAQVPRPLAIGVGFELARAPSIHPQAHDVPLDAVVTEAGILRPR
ncbi:MAG: 5-formyltetrahydrofolate cyclo-ligase, partial [Rugosibacter sp.]